MQTYFRFNSSGTDPDFGTGLNSLDWRGKGQAGEKSVLFCSSKSQKPQGNSSSCGLCHGDAKPGRILSAHKKKGGKKFKNGMGNYPIIPEKS